MIWHSASCEEVLSELNVDSNKGLANGVADDRLKIYGENAIKNIENKSFMKIFLSSLKSGWVIALTLIALLSFLLSLIYSSKDFYSPLLIIAIVV